MDEEIFATTLRDKGIFDATALCHAHLEVLNFTSHALYHLKNVYCRSYI